MDKIYCHQKSYDKEVLTAMNINQICLERQLKGDYNYSCEMHQGLWSKWQEELECVRDFGGHLWGIDRKFCVQEEEGKNCKDNLVLTPVHWKIAKQFHFDNDVALRVVKIYSPQHLRTNSLIIVRYRIGLDKFMTFHLPLHFV